MTKRNWMCVCFCFFWEKQLQLVPEDWMRNTACSPIPCFLEHCHPDVQNRPLVWEGWVAASPLRGLFLQGHTHAWSEAHRGGSSTRRLYLLCLTSVTPHSTSYRTKALRLSGWQQVTKLARSIEKHVFSQRKLKHENHQNWNLQDFHPTRRINPFKWISLKSKSDNEWELAIKTPLCTLYTNVPTFPHTCFDMQIAMKEIWKHSCPLLTNT